MTICASLAHHITSAGRNTLRTKFAIPKILRTLQDKAEWYSESGRGDDSNGFTFASRKRRNLGQIRSSQVWSCRRAWTTPFQINDIILSEKKVLHGVSKMATYHLVISAVVLCLVQRCESFCVLCLWILSPWIFWWRNRCVAEGGPRLVYSAPGICAFAAVCLPSKLEFTRNSASIVIKARLVILTALDSIRRVCGREFVRFN